VRDKDGDKSLTGYERMENEDGSVCYYKDGVIKVLKEDILPRQDAMSTEGTMPSTQDTPQKKAGDTMLAQRDTVSTQDTIPSTQETMVKQHTTLKQETRTRI
jgi:hypothetical protein